MKIVVNFCKYILICYVYLVLLSVFVYPNAIEKKVLEGNRLFEKAEYEEALSKYTDAQTRYPESAILDYNIGDVLYKQQKYKESKQMFEKAMPKADNELKSKIYYNIGNCEYRQGKLQESIDYYKESLNINPDNKDAKYNIEFVKKKLKELQTKIKETEEKQKNKREREKQKDERKQSGGEQKRQKKEEPQQKKQEKKSGKQEEEQQQDKKEGKMNKEKEGEQKAEEEEKSIQQEKKDSQKGQDDKEKERQSMEKQGDVKDKKSGMSKEQAEALINMVEDEAKNKKPIRRIPEERAYETDKPW